MLRKAGYLWIFVSIIHGIGGVVLYSRQWQAIAQDGWFNAVAPNPFAPIFDREDAFWFIFLTPFIFLLGKLCLWLDRHELNLPMSFSITILTTVLTGLLLMPVSGLWLVLIPTVMMLYSSKSAQFSLKIHYERSGCNTAAKSTAYECR
jgi:hypothetical protein